MWLVECAEGEGEREGDGEEESKTAASRGGASGNADGTTTGGKRGRPAALRAASRGSGDVTSAGPRERTCDATKPSVGIAAGDGVERCSDVEETEERGVATGLWASAATPDQPDGTDAVTERRHGDVLARAGDNGDGDGAGDISR